MTRLQWTVIVSFLLFFAFLYFVLDTKPDEIKQIEQSRSLSIESTDVNILIREAKQKLEAKDANAVRILEQELELAIPDSVKSKTFKELSGLWYRLNYQSIAGNYAEQAALVEDSEESWSIAGTTYAICVQRSTEDRIREFCTSRALKAFENAISLNPDEIQHKVNLALVNLETENPMAGIQMLLDLNRKYPENVLVLMTLAKQAIRSNQLEKASERLLSILDIEPNQKEAACMLVDVYNKLQQPQKAQQYLQRCQL